MVLFMMLLTLLLGGGTHHGNNAGNDVSDRIVKAPHGKSTLEKLEVVGKLG